MGKLQHKGTRHRTSPVVERKLLEKKLFPSSVACVISSLQKISRLTREERLSLSSVSENRIQEFAGGRWAAKKALTRLGVKHLSLPRQEDKTPLWPKGYTGSITHCDGLLAAAACSTDDFYSLGLDVESTTRPLNISGISRFICTPREKSEHLKGTAVEVKKKLLLIFSAKESLFKGLYPLVQTFFGFKAAQLAPLVNKGLFTLELMTDLHSKFKKGMIFQGRYVFTSTHIYTGLTISNFSG